MSHQRLVAHDALTGEYVEIGNAWDHDLLAFLADGSDAVAEATALLRARNRTVAARLRGCPFRRVRCAPSRSGKPT